MKKVAYKYDEFIGYLKAKRKKRQHDQIIHRSVKQVRRMAKRTRRLAGGLNSLRRAIVHKDA
ncbi:hypothetical protein LR69_01236 [Geobacillus sp. BCO2]|nr:hypothetical protein LR69_01236 [Geobacillus sp. BCO2]